ILVFRPQSRSPAAFDPLGCPLRGRRRDQESRSTMAKKPAEGIKSAEQAEGVTTAKGKGKPKAAAEPAADKGAITTAPAPAEEKKIADIVKFEAKQQIPFNLDEVVWDFQKIGSGNVVDGFALETEIGLFAIKRDVVSRFMTHFNEVGVEVHLIQMAPLALCN